ncbi:hypothetical protein MUO74_06565 [Candidatus Bathyarchaeota archaeon]|nr:hypothetical protein [Candidatus Bathyarchaeota archaeon]
MDREDFIVEQYKECGRAAALYDNAIWQVPSTAFLASGALVSLAYGYVSIPYVRGIVIIIAAIWVFVLFVVMNKHMFFAAKQKEKMIRIEVKEFKISSLQRFAKCREKLVKDLVQFEYAFDGWENPKGIGRMSGHLMLRLGMASLLVVLVALALLNFL